MPNMIYIPNFKKIIIIIGGGGATPVIEKLHYCSGLRHETAT
jgi:hypothetical protein